MRLINYIIKRRNQRKAFEQLWSMSDRQLRDMGIYRGQICEVVYGSNDNKGLQDD